MPGLPVGFTRLLWDIDVINVYKTRGTVTCFSAQ